LRVRSGERDVDAAETEVVHALAQDQECGCDLAPERQHGYLYRRAERPRCEVLPQYCSIELGVYAVYASRKHLTPRCAC